MRPLVYLAYLEVAFVGELSGRSDEFPYNASEWEKPS